MYIYIYVYVYIYYMCVYIYLQHTIYAEKCKLQSPGYLKWVHQGIK